MNESEILRFVDTIHRDKEIDKEYIFQAIEAAYLTSVKKKLGESETLRVVIDRETGGIEIYDDQEPVEVEDLGRIAASTGKQVLFQKIREAERDVIYDEYVDKVSTLVSGVVQRQEGPNLIVSLNNKIEGFLPRSEQAPGERFRVGERIKVLIQDIVKNGNRVRIVLSRTSPEMVRALFELEVPEIADRTIEVKKISREPGYRTKIAVTTFDPNVDCVGACVGVRGSRIKNIVDELFGEKIDIVRWNESIEVLIMNALKPAEIASMDLDFDKRLAKVYVRADQQSIAIGKRGQNVRLASKMTEWDIDILTVSEEELEKMKQEDVDEEGRPIDIIVGGATPLESTVEARPEAPAAVVSKTAESAEAATGGGAAESAEAPSGDAAEAPSGDDAESAEAPSDDDAESAEAPSDDDAPEEGDATAEGEDEIAANDEGESSENEPGEDESTHTADATDESIAAEPVGATEPVLEDDNGELSRP